MQGAMVMDGAGFWMVINRMHAIEFQHGERAIGYYLPANRGPLAFVPQALVGDGTLVSCFSRYLSLRFLLHIYPPSAELVANIYIT